MERIDVTGPASRLVARLEAFAPDIIFNTAEGRRGRMRRGFYSALFEELGMPATGSDAYALCVTLDKALTKKLLAGYGIPSPEGASSRASRSAPAGSTSSPTRSSQSRTSRGR